MLILVASAISSRLRCFCSRPRRRCSPNSAGAIRRAALAAFWGERRLRGVRENTAADLLLTGIDLDKGGRRQDTRRACGRLASRILLFCRDEYAQRLTKR